MKVALITDSHHGCRNNNKLFLDAQEAFYKNQFFPELEKQNIKHIIHAGDIFDNRKASNIYMLQRQKEFFVDAIVDGEYSMDLVLGNHDVAFKNTNQVNAPYNHLSHIPNISIIDQPIERWLDGKRIAFCPWINRENEKECLKFIKNCKADLLVGHFDIAGFEMIRGKKSEHGLKRSLFSHIDMVLSGHFHHKSAYGNIQYLGAPFEFTWNDWNDPRGFHILDTEDMSLDYIPNIDHMFYKFVYSEEDEEINFDDYDLKDKFVKLIVKERPKHKKYFAGIQNKIAIQEPYDFQIVDLSHDDLYADLSADDIAERVKDTPSLICEYVRALEGVNKPLKKKTEDLLLRLNKEALVDD